MELVSEGIKMKTVTMRVDDAIYQMIKIAADGQAAIPVHQFHTK